MEYKVKSAVAMVVFNRYDNAKKVFEEIKKVRPTKFFVIADGPRNNVPEDAEKCKKVREIFDNIDWECEVYKNFSDENLGCSKRPYTGFSWVFEHVDEAIFLEDDCLPDISFFKYCDELLEKYRNDSRVMLISGTNQIKRWKRGEYSYHFSDFGGIWGWASWKRAWQYFDINIKMWNNDNVKKLLKQKMIRSQYNNRKVIYDGLYNNSKDTTAWDYQWGFARIVQSGVAISPSVNLITNIGNGQDATHTAGKSKVSNLPSMEMQFPLKHPPFLMVDKEYDKEIYKVIKGGIINQIKDFIVRILKKWKKY